ncbi:TRAP transporter small permease [Pseudomonas berkeleyensis]|uniref:TRAP transporter small permease protein n=1 Tax=Pseudomonas berkeleyensis TaxID=2726956 RepID=A0A7G5DIM0_9PSED|nr:TRAP transporter small permease [Pseudomonas berkeleyensis]QMV61595.1 TRAP transporter small permease [Pseudomonas berkeleyensis]WSO37025.1 TRAP transporter small permease [Pseudomonas berkeleyensis]
MSWLRKLYTLSGLLAGLFLILICVLIVAQILARQFGTMIPSTDEFAAYCMAASGFLALPYALMRGAHIRVELLFRILPQRSLFAVEVLGNMVGLLIAAYLAWYCALFVLESYEFKEVSSGLLPIPMWIPQIPMVLGTVILVIAMAERLVLVCRGQRFEDQTPGVMSE